MASIKVDLKSHPTSAPPSEIYRGSHPARLRLQPRLRIAGEPGQYALIKALANQFIKFKDENDDEQFSIAWSASTTTASYDYLASKSVDITITHHVAADNIAIKQGIASRSVYAWKDDWLLVGPKSNPADLDTDGVSIHDQFAQIFLIAVETAGSSRPVRFLSCFDKSAANIKESSIWAAIGQTPWAHPHSSWYHQSPDTPLVALQTASDLGQYTITNRGTWYALDGKSRDQLNIFNAGGDTEGDWLLNPVRILVGRHARDQQLADEFTDWVVRWNGGQKVIENFEVEKPNLSSKSSLMEYDTPFTPPHSPSRKNL